VRLIPTWQTSCLVGRLLKQYSAGGPDRLVGRAWVEVDLRRPTGIEERGRWAIGPRGGRRPSVVGYVTVTGAKEGATPVD